MRELHCGEEGDEGASDSGRVGSVTEVELDLGKSERGSQET
jgi:hypothetical protein